MRISPRQRLRALAATCTAIACAPAGSAAAEQPLEPLAGQVRLTQQGPDGDATFDAAAPDVAYSPRRNEFLVAWAGQDLLAPREVEVYARRLDGAGNPAGDVLRLTTAGAAGETSAVAGEPAIVYDAVHDLYAVAYAGTTGDGGTEIFVRFVDGSGTLTSAPQQVSTPRPATSAVDPDIVYHGPDDRFLVVWRRESSIDGAAEIAGRLVNARSGAAEGLIEFRISDEDALAQRPAEPVATIRPVDGSYAVFWTGDVDPTGEREVFGRLVARDGTVDARAPRQRVTAAGPPGDPAFDASSPALAVNPASREILLAYVAPDRAEGDEVYVQRLSDDLVALDIGRRVSSAGRSGSRDAHHARHPTVDFHSRHASYLVTWQGSDDGRPGLGDSEIELSGQVLDATAVEIGTDDFVISRMGLDGSGFSAPAPAPATVAMNDHTAEWLVVWAADDARPPLADDELELWGRRVGRNHDRDYDGSPVARDCDDLDPRRTPGAFDIPHNGVDEDCTGRDSLDGDGDGVPQPADCDDRDRFVSPRRPDIPGNGVDENCSGRDSLLPTRARVRATWLFGAVTTASRLIVERVRSGMTITVRCAGPGCPDRLRRKDLRFRVQRSGTLRLEPALQGATLRPGARVEVRIRDPRALGVRERYTIRRGQPPRRQTRCLAPGRHRPVRCP